MARGVTHISFNFHVSAGLLLRLPCQGVAGSPGELIVACTKHVENTELYALYVSITSPASRILGSTLGCGSMCGEHCLRY